MANNYFWSGLYQTLQRLTTARAEAVQAIFSVVESGFNELPDPLTIQTGTVTYALDTGTVDAYACTLPVATSQVPITAYSDGMMVSVKLANTNDGPSTLNVNQIANLPIVHYDGSPVAAGELPQGLVADFRIIGSTQAQIRNPAGSSTAAAYAAAAASSASIATAGASSAAASAASATATGMPRAVATGTPDVITATYAQTITLANMVTVEVVASGANATATPTFSPNGLPAHVITKKGGIALGIGDIPNSTSVFILSYNLANTRWELINPASPATPTPLGSNTRTSAANVTLTASDVLYQSIALTTAGTSIIEADATTLAATGVARIIHNTGSITAPIRRSDGSAICFIAPGGIATLKVEDISTPRGLWTWSGQGVTAVYGTKLNASGVNNNSSPYNGMKPLFLFNNTIMVFSTGSSLYTTNLSTGDTRFTNLSAFVGGIYCAASVNATGSAALVLVTGYTTGGPQLVAQPVTINNDGTFGTIGASTTSGGGQSVVGNSSMALCACPGNTVSGNFTAVLAWQAATTAGNYLSLVQVSPTAVSIGNGVSAVSTGYAFSRDCLAYSQAQGAVAFSWLQGTNPSVIAATVSGVTLTLGTVLGTSMNSFNQPSLVQPADNVFCLLGEYTTTALGYFPFTLTGNGINSGAAGSYALPASATRPQGGSLWGLSAQLSAAAGAYTFAFAEGGSASASSNVGCISYQLTTNGSTVTGVSSSPGLASGTSLNNSGRVTSCTVQDFISGGLSTSAIMLNATSGFSNGLLQFTSNNALGISSVQGGIAFYDPNGLASLVGVKGAALLIENAEAQGWAPTVSRHTPSGAIDFGYGAVMSTNGGSTTANYLPLVNGYSLGYCPGTSATALLEVAVP